MHVTTKIPLLTGVVVKKELKASTEEEKTQRIKKRKSAVGVVWCGTAGGGEKKTGIVMTGSGKGRNYPER